MLLTKDYPQKNNCSWLKLLTNNTSDSGDLTANWATQRHGLLRLVGSHSSWSPISLCRNALSHRMCSHYIFSSFRGACNFCIRFFGFNMIKLFKVWRLCRYISAHRRYYTCSFDVWKDFVLRLGWCQEVHSKPLILSLKFTFGRIKKIYGIRLLIGQ